MKRCLIMTHKISFQDFPSCIIYYFCFLVVRDVTSLLCCLFETHKGRILDANDNGRLSVLVPSIAPLFYSE
jgi:hypothetical protein